MFLRVGTLVLKEFIQFLRDWLMSLFIITLPVLQLILMAQSTGSRISELCVAVFDVDQSGVSRRLVTALDNKDELTVCYRPMTLVETHRLLDQGEATLVVIIPAGLDTGLAAAPSSSDAPSVQLVTDASNSVPAKHALGAARDAIAAFVEDLASTYDVEAGSLINLSTVVRFNPTLNIRFFTVSAQVGFVIYQVTLVVASIGLARERELGTLEQLMVVPLRRVELVIGKAIPALIIGAINFLIILAVTVFVFGVPMRGSLSLLFALTLLFVATEIGYGIFISGIARTQQQAVLIVFVLAMVDMTFSGYLVRVKNLPVALQAVAQVVPFRHYLAIVRGIMLKGAGMKALWQHALAIGLMGVFVTAMAVHNLSKSLD